MKNLAMGDGADGKVAPGSQVAGFIISHLGKEVEMQTQLVRRMVVSDGTQKCLHCRKGIQKGKGFEQWTTPNKRGVAEFWSNICRGCVARLLKCSS